ncbi:hypothetical protein C0585_03400 [Candidatus Woesearchaeota archaeon]|nr:MAG: hypothetical protein C0585_03400 [Candidatus Woesearchaeota archaeon]
MRLKKLLRPRSKCLAQIEGIDMGSIIQFDKIDENLKEVFGEKAYNLASARKYANIPNGFVLNDEIMRRFLDHNGLISLIGRYLDNLMVDNENIIPIVNAIQKAIISGNFPSDIKEDISEFYESLSHTSIHGAKDFLKNDSLPLVCIRNGVYSDNDSIYQLNIKGMDNLLNNIKIIFASNYTSQKIIKRKDENEDLIENGINPVIIQKMIGVQRSGISYSYNPNINVSNECVIKAMFGLGIGKDDRKLSFDEYIIDKDYEIIGSKIAKQDYAYEKDLESDKTVKYSLDENAAMQKLSESMIKEVAQTTRKLKRIFDREVILEFGFLKNTLILFDIKPQEIMLKEPQNIDEDKVIIPENRIEDINVTETIEIVDIEPNDSKDIGFEIEEDIKEYPEEIFVEEKRDEEDTIEEILTLDDLESDEVVPIIEEEVIIEKDDDSDVYISNIDELQSDENEDDIVDIYEENIENIEDESKDSEFGYNFIDDNDNEKIIAEEQEIEKIFDEEIEHVETDKENLVDDYKNIGIPEVSKVEEEDADEPKKENILFSKEKDNEEVIEGDNDFFENLNEDDNKNNFIFDNSNNEKEELLDYPEKNIFDNGINEESNLFETAGEELSIEKDADEKTESDDDFFSRIEVEDDGDFIFDNSDNEKKKEEDF